MKNNSNLIGVGSYGEVYKVALKKIKKILVSEAEFKTEINILKELECEYSVKYIDHYETNNEYNLILELCDCNLRDILNEYKKINKGLPINIIKKILKQLNVVMKKMNESNITHRDIKPENILIKFLDEKKEDFNIKLSDYGAGKELNSTKSNLTVVGTNKYMAPEVEDGVYNNKVDLWSIGVLIYELYYNDYIFKGNNVKETFENRYNCKIVRDIPDDNLNNLLKKLIQPKDKRIDFDEYYNDNFFKENENNKNEFNDNDDNEFDRYYSKEEIEEQKKQLNFMKNKKKILKIIIKIIVMMIMIILMKMILKIKKVIIIMKMIMRIIVIIKIRIIIIMIKIIKIIIKKILDHLVHIVKVLIHILLENGLCQIDTHIFVIIVRLNLIIGELILKKMDLKDQY